MVEILRQASDTAGNALTPSSRERSGEINATDRRKDALLTTNLRVIE
jgi:hypothetical protein